MRNKHREFIEYLFLNVIICLVLSTVCMLAQPSREQSSIAFAESYLAIPEYIEKRDYYYIGFMQGRSLFVRFEFSEKHLEQFLSSGCVAEQSNLSSKKNPLSNNRDMGLLGQVPVWWSPVEDEFYMGGECVITAKEGHKEKNAAMSISLKNGKAVIYLFLTF